MLVLVVNFTMITLSMAFPINIVLMIFVKL